MIFRNERTADLQNSLLHTHTHSHTHTHTHLSAGVVEGGRLQVVDRVDRRVSRHEHAHDVEVALLARPVEGRVVVAIPLVHVSVVVDVLQQRVQIALGETDVRANVASIRESDVAGGRS